MDLTRADMEAQMRRFASAVEARGDRALIFYMSVPAFLRYLTPVEVEGGRPLHGWKQLDGNAGCWIQALEGLAPESLVQGCATSMMFYEFDWLSNKGTRQLGGWDGLQGKPEGFAL